MGNTSQKYLILPLKIILAEGTLFYRNKKERALEIWFRPEQVQKELHVSVVIVDETLYPFAILPVEQTFSLNFEMRIC